MSGAAEQIFARVRELYETARAAQRVVVDLDEIPFSYELISDEWLSKAICRDAPGARVVAHSLDRPDEGTCNRRRIFLRYNTEGVAAGLPPSVFCKATQSLESRFILGLNGCAEGEITFHNKVRGLLDIEAPLSYFSNIDRQSLNSITLLRDMAGQVQFCDERTAVTKEMAKSQLALLARLHGRFHDASELQTLLQDFQTIEQFANRTEAAIRWSDAQYKGFLAAESVIPARLFRRAKDIWEATERAFDRHRELPRTLIHNDVHLKNWYIAASGNMGLNDWQCGVRGHWSRDLAYVLSTALTPENRRAWEQELIAYYLDRLHTEGVPKPAYDEALALYRQQLFAALIMWTTTLSPAPGSPQMQPPAASLRFIERIAHAIDDHDAFASFPEH